MDHLPVLLHVRKSDNVVSVRMLLETPIGLAEFEGDGYKRIGQLREVEWNEFDKRARVTRRKKGWQWWYDEEEWGSATGKAKTKAEALAALLDAGGYVEAPPNATNQGLF
jgi:hypothetical protein